MLTLTSRDRVLSGVSALKCFPNAAEGKGGNGNWDGKSVLYDNGSDRLRV